MYQNFYYNRKDGLCHLWDDDGYKVFPFEPYAYQIDSKGEYETITGLKVKKVKSWSKEAEKQGLVFEHDVPIATRVLIDRYYQSDEPSKDHRVLFFDIEIEKGLRYSTPKDALNRITSIAYYFNNQYVCLLLDENNRLEDCTKTIIIDGKEVPTIVKRFGSEHGLLTTFVSHWQKIKPTIASGWNCITKGSYVLTNNGLKKIENILDGDLIYNDIANLTFKTGLKPELQIKTSIGNVLNASREHKLPFYSVPKGRYINCDTIEQFKDESTISNIINNFSKNNILVNIPKIYNDNHDLTYRDILIHNLDAFFKYDGFDLYVKTPKIVKYVKENRHQFPTLKDSDIWGKYASNKWKSKNLKHIPNNLILEYISVADEVEFSFNSKERTRIQIGDKIPNELCQLIGFIYTDGTFTKKYKTLGFCNKYEEVVHHYTRILNNFSLRKSNVLPTSRKQDNCYYMRVGIQNKLGLLFPFIYETTCIKNLNVELLSLLSYSQFLYFMSGVVDGDGSVKDNAVYVSNYEKTYENNVESFQKLLFRNGILSRITKNCVRIPSTGVNNFNFLSNMQLSHPVRASKLAHLYLRLKKNSKSYKYDWFETNDNYIVKLKSIVDTGNIVEMYDINTNDGYFIANSIKVHNCDVFDTPYLIRRVENVLGYKYMQKFSPIGIVERREIGKRDIGYKIAGVSFLDYMQLYKKFTYNEEPSYALDFICKKELKRGKYVYEGTLDDLFNNDIDGFIEYNVNDVELMVALDKKKDLIQTAIGICHAGHVPYEDYLFSSRYLEGASLVYCKRNNLIAIRSSLGTENNGEAEGAMVKVPKPGIYKYIIDLDLTSLYPSLIRTLNISPETIFGKIVNWDENDWIKKVEKTYIFEPYSTLQDKLMGSEQKKVEIKSSDFWEFIQSKNLSIASNGLLLKQDKQGLIPSILTHWFNERKRLSKLAEEYGLSGDKDKYRYYDQQQLIQKILLNSFYGVLLLPSFRFYNKDAGEAITISGQHVIKFSMRVANNFCNSKLNTQEIDYVASGDTDSMFLPVYQFINPNNEDLDKDVLVERTLEFANEIQTKINQSYDVYAERLFNVKTHYLNIKQEMIALRGFFLNAKKRYALWIINKKGVPVEESEIKGLDVVRSSFPKLYRSEMKEIIRDILHDSTKDELNKKVREFKKVTKDCDIFDIMKPSSVKEMSKYKHGQKGTPNHVKSAQNYNKLLELHKIESIPMIDDGDKILYCYLKRNPFGFESIALKGQGEDPEELVNFVKQYIDRETEFQTTYLSKLETIWNDLGWGKIELQEPIINDYF